MKKAFLFLVMMFLAVSFTACVSARPETADDLIVPVSAADLTSDDPAAPVTDTVESVLPAPGPVITVTQLVTVTEVVEKVVPVEKIVTQVVTVTVAMTDTVPGPLDASSGKIPGMTAEKATMAEPETWVADNGQACKWDIPGGTKPAARTDAYVFTNCMTINLAPKATFDFDWQYGNWDYWNGSHAVIMTHSVRDFLLWNWASPDGEPKYAGIAWWGPQTGSLVTVRYGDSQPCTGRSFEIPTDPSMHVSGTIANTSDRTAAVWSQGPWVLEENVSFGGGGVFEPECRPGKTGNQVSATGTGSASAAPPTAPVAPAKDAALKDVSTTATYGPIVFTAKGKPVKVQHLGDWSFHLTGWDIDTKAEGFVCIWYDWATKKVITTEWTGDYRLDCKWSPPSQ